MSKSASLRHTLRNRIRTHRAAARLRRRGVATMAGHCIAAGLAPRDARSMAGSLRRSARKADCEGAPGRSYSGRRPARDCTRYTPAEAARAAALYRPRRTDFQAAQRLLVLAADDACVLCGYWTCRCNEVFGQAPTVVLATA